MNKTTKIIVLAIALVCFAIATFAQGGPGFPDPPADTPIDGGVLLVATAAIGYGARKLRKKRQG